MNRRKRVLYLGYCWRLDSQRRLRVQLVISFEEGGIERAALKS